MKTIIVPVDFSPHSEFALKAAAQMAKKYDAELIALHMLELSDTLLNKGSGTMHNEAIFFLKLAEQKFDEFLEKDYLQDIKVTPLVKHFKVFSEVSDVAKQYNADMIVMGSHGTSGIIREIFIGSNTEKVVRYSEIPVFVVKEEVRNLDFNAVVFASDFADESISAYKRAQELFKGTDTHIKLVYVNTPGDNFKPSLDMRKKVDSFLMKADGNTDANKYAAFVSDYTVEKGVLNYAYTNKVGAIIVPTHGRTGIAHFIQGSISEDIANHAVLPVITLKI